jgi:ferric-dicitrate binding protein FerR (iron transport regulator)
VSDDHLSPDAAELTQLARRTLGHMSDAQHARGLETVRGHQARRRTERRRRLLAFGGLSAATAAAAFLLVPGVLQRMHQRYDDPPLALQVESGAVGPAGAIVPSGHEQAALRFGDGTVIKLGSETRGRLAAVDGRGAHVAIENGSAHVSVVHKPKARWLIDAGPYQITVHGTVFTAAWDDRQQRLDVKMERGLVSVAGPVTNGPIAVRAGQVLTVRLKRSQVLLRDLDRDDVVADLDADDDASAETPEAAQAMHRDAEEDAPAPAATPLRARIAAKGARGPRVKSWTAALSAGDFDAILEDAERDIGHALASSGTEDLAALADAARYRRHDDVARRALLAQRRRFAGSPRAADAAFFLGRLDENGGRGAGPALAWYERYLDEAPRGSYAAEALGRKMIAVEELHGPAAARNVAEQYVRRFPRGSYAGAARALLGAR